MQRESGATRKPAHPERSFAAPVRAIAQSVVRMSSTRMNSQLGLLFDFAVAFILLDAGMRGRHAPASGVPHFAAGSAVSRLGG